MAGDDRSTICLTPSGLLGATDPPPVETMNPQGRSPFLLVGDHSGNLIPTSLGTLGLAPDDRARHIAWDIGTATLGARLAHRLDAVFIRQVYSRLLIDCNRDPEATDAVPETSDGTMIPGNRGCSAPARAQRIAEIHAPYQAAIAAEIARRGAAGRPTLLVALHSFTPRMGGVVRPWQIGILHDRGNTGLALALRDWLRAQRRWVVGDNEPYVMDATDHTVPRHAFAAGLGYAEIEIAQSELADDAGCQRWCDILAEGLEAAAAGPR